MISSVYTKSHTWLPSHPNSKMLQILNFVTYIWVSELDLASMQGFRSLSFYCCSLSGQSIAVLPKPPPTSTPFSGSPLGNLPQGFCRTWASHLSYSVFVPRTKWGHVSSLVPAGCHLSSPSGTWRRCRQHSVHCSWHQFFSSLPLPTLSYPSLENCLLSCQGFQPSFLQEMLFSVSPQSPWGKELAFHSQLATVWSGRQWE